MLVAWRLDHVWIRPTVGNTEDLQAAARERQVEMMRIEIEDATRLEALLRFLRERGHDASRSSSVEVILRPPAEDAHYREKVKRDLATWHLVTRQLTWIVPE